MEIAVGVALVLAGLAVYALAYSQPLPVVVAAVAGAVPTIVGRTLLADAGVLEGVWRWVVVALWAVAFFFVHQTAFVLRGIRSTATGVLVSPRPVAEPHVELASLTDVMRSLGFVLVPEGVVQVGANHLAVMVHDDGTRLEIIQGDGLPAGYACATEMRSERHVVSVPWAHGIDDDRIRVPGATLPELLEHQRAEVARRVADGDVVRPVAPTDALAAVIASDQDELAEMLAAPWRNSFRMAVQQTPFRGLVGT